VSGDCEGCVERVTEVASVIAALLARLGVESVDLTDEELERFTPDTAIAFNRSDARCALQVSVVEAKLTGTTGEPPCGS